MKHSAAAVVAALAVMPFTTSAYAVARDDSADDDVDTDVCYPDTTDSDVAAPCFEITVIEATCQPNGTDAEDYDAHAQCMCDGSYFSDWVGCQKCLVVHGFRNDQDFEYWQSVLSVASEGLCTGTPTAAFPSYFQSAEYDTDAVPPVTTGNTEYVDVYPGMTEVSLYYTPTVSQGPGPVNGAATAATVVQSTEPATIASFEATETPKSTAKETDDNGWNFFGTDADEPTSTQAPGTNGAAPTQKAGLAMAIAGAALVFAV
jgi:hypothetical protein